MRSPNRHDHGFTLVELMITVGIIGLLAAIAIPNFISYQARSRRSEAYVNLASLARAYKAFHAEQGYYPDMDTETAEPTLPDWTLYGGDLGTHKMPWDADTEAFFDIVGWQVEGEVFYSYDVNSVNCGCGADGSQCFTATAYGDVDADDSDSAVMYVHPQRDPATDAVLAECQSTLFGYGAPVVGGVTAYDQVAIQITTDDY